MLYSQHFTQYFHNILRNTFTTKFMWKVVISSNLNPLFKLFFYSSISTNNNLSLKIYCENIIVMLLNFDFLFLILFSFLSLVFFFHPYVFFFLFFFLVFSPPHTNTYPQYLSSLFVWLFVFLVISRTFLPFSLSLSFSFSYAHTQISLPQSHTNKFAFIHA